MAASACNTTPLASRFLGASVTMMPAPSRSVASLIRPVFRQTDACSNNISSSTFPPQVRGTRAYHSTQLHSHQKYTCISRNIQTARLSNKSSMRASPCHIQRYPQIRQFSNSSALRLFRSRGNGAEGQVRPKKRFRLLRWTFRLTYLSLILGIGYVGYGIYIGRSPAEQMEPDPNKKTLVVLGMFVSHDQREGDQHELIQYQELAGDPSLF